MVRKIVRTIMWMNLTLDCIRWSMLKILGMRRRMEMMTSPDSKMLKIFQKIIKTLPNNNNPIPRTPINKTLKIALEKWSMFHSLRLSQKKIPQNPLKKSKIPTRITRTNMMFLISPYQVMAKNPILNQLKMKTTMTSLIFKMPPK